MLTTVTIWLLISVSGGNSNMGTLTVVERFATAEACQEVLKQVPHAGTLLLAKCVQAKVAR